MRVRKSEIHCKGTFKGHICLPGFRDPCPIENKISLDIDGMNSIKNASSFPSISPNGDNFNYLDPGSREDRVLLFWNV